MHQRACRTTRPQEVANQVQNLRMQNRWSFEVFSRSSSAGENKNPRADDGADSQRGERPRPERLF